MSLHVSFGDFPFLTLFLACPSHNKGARNKRTFALHNYSFLNIS